MNTRFQCVTKSVLALILLPSGVLAQAAPAEGGTAVTVPAPATITITTPSADTSLPVVPAPPAIVVAPPVPVTPAIAQPAEKPAAVSSQASTEAQKQVLTNGTLKVDGTVFFKYRYEWINNPSSEVRGFNAFELERGYLNFDFSNWKDAKLRLQLDAGDKREVEGTTSTQLNVVTKNLFFEASNLLWTGDKVRVGLQNVPSVEFENGIWGYRHNNKIAADKYRYMQTVDMGVSYSALVPGGFGSWTVMVANGEGWTATESGKDKDYHLFVSLTPVRSYKAFSFSFAGMKGTDDAPTKRGTSGTRITQDAKDRLWGMLAWKQPRRLTLGLSHTVAFQSTTRDDMQMPRAFAVSGFAVLNSSLISSSNKWELVARYDVNDAALNGVTGNEHRFTMGGLSYYWNDKIMTTVSSEGQVYTGKVTGPSTFNERRYLVQTKVDF